MEKLSESFLLLALHPVKARYLISTQKLNVGLQGSILMDLFLEDKIRLDGKRVNLKNRHARSGSVESEMIDRISKAKKPPRIKSLVSNDSLKGRKYRFRVFEDMQRKGLVKIEAKKFWIIPYRLVTLSKQNARRDLIEKIKQLLSKPDDISDKDAALLALINACRIYRVLGREPKELRENKRKLKSIVKENAISQGVGKAIREMEAAVASTIAISAAAGASS